ncbi:c6 transcription [Nannochloropsis gaditana]|uniref:C6 transcription n=1 Tax=Nannochloropsis gaditana TaxID=72520 RepID=W7TS94_9STRA|nr:c6 transcription [Nannochloropsis gaditana]
MDFPGALRTRASTGGITKETRRSVGPPPEEMKRKRAPRLLCTCVRCRTGKIKCDGNYPCARCWRLSLPCRVQRLDSWASTPLMQLVVDRGDPLALKSLYMRAFCQLEEEGKILRKKALDML